MVKTRPKKLPPGQYAELASSNDDDAEASSSTPEGDSWHGQRETPKKKAKTKASIPSSQKVKLQRLGDGRCLITCEKEPGVAIQACHIVRRKTFDDEVDTLQQMWNLQAFNIDSTSNLVTLRADWHAAFDAGCWALVPELKVLENILANIVKGTYHNPYRNKPQVYKYVFVPLPPLGRKFIHRFNVATNTFDTFSPDTSYANFPILRYHAHAFCVIVNALPKLKRYSAVLSPHHQDLLGKMLLIEAGWQNKLESMSTPSRGVTRQWDDNDSEDEEDEDSHQDKRRRTNSRKGKEKEKEKGKGKEKPKEKRDIHSNRAAGSRKHVPGGHKSAQVIQNAAYPSPPHSDNLDITPVGHHDGHTSVVAWRDKVIPLEPPLDTKTSWGFDEPACAPFTGDWHTYNVPWKRPVDHSQFSSTDWAFHHFMFLLPGPVRPWDEDDYWGDNLAQDSCSE